MARSGAAGIGLTLVVLGPACSSAADERPELDAIHLFDCAGWIQMLDRNGPSAAVHVADLIETLPERVHDGCAIHAGRLEHDAGVLELVVQTAAIESDAGATPTGVLRLATPSLEPLSDVAAPRDRTQDERPTSLPDLRMLEPPFDVSIGYPSADRSRLLLQELDPLASPASALTVDRLWETGAVSLRAARPGATGRYALMDLGTGGLVGRVVSSGGEPGSHRVICFSPAGRIFLAAGRDSLLVLDVDAPASRSTVDGLRVDLHWTACAV